MLSTRVSALIKIIKREPFPPLCTTYDNAELSDEIRNFEKNSLSNNSVLNTSTSNLRDL